MKRFLITYDNHPPRNYVALYQLMAMWNAVRLSQSVWLVTLNGSGGTVRDIVLGVLEPNDLVTVVELLQGADWAVSYSTPSAAKTWLSNNVTPSQAAA